MRRKIVRLGLITLGLYGSILLLAAFLEKKYPSGPCVPGGGFMLILMVLPLLAVTLLVISLILGLRGRKQYFLPATIHGLVLLAFALMIW